MSGVSTLAFRQDLLKLRFLGTAAPASFEVALTRKVPTTNSAEDQLDEPTGLAYARQTIALGGGNWAMINENEVANTGTLYFPSATGSWGTIHGWALLAVTTGIVQAVGTLNEPIRVVTGVRPYLGAGSITFGLYD